jgi:hypothetical protein
LLLSKKERNQSPVPLWWEKYHLYLVHCCPLLSTVVVLVAVVVVVVVVECLFKTQDIKRESDVSFYFEAFHTRFLIFCMPKNGIL